MHLKNIQNQSNETVIVVDLDGTLICSDALHESTIKTLRSHPYLIFSIPSLLAKGKANLKKHFASLAAPSPELLPYNLALLEWLKAQKELGRILVLCTASDKQIANAVADHLQIFDEVLASDGIINLAGHRKADFLVERYGEHGFDYAGNSQVDVAVWKRARKAIVVNASSKTEAEARKICEVAEVFSQKTSDLKTWLKALRVHQWLKNLLLFMPLFAAHDITNWAAWIALVFAFLSFSFCASSVYIANDLLDLETDRAHPRKKYRPFASGALPIWKGVVVAPLLLVTSLIFATFAGPQFILWLSLYFILTCVYSWTLKKWMLIDCMTLAFLYTLRIIAGAAAVSQSLSFWLLAFSVFLFLSLAFVKRYAELEVLVLSGKEKIQGRGYYTTDAPLIQTMGIVSGYGSVLVLALYLNSDAVMKLYSAPQIIWLDVPVMLFWISWMWIQAHRGQMHDDPLVFAVKDKVSLAAGFVFAAVLAAGTVGINV